MEGILIYIILIAIVVSRMKLKKGGETETGSTRSAGRVPSSSMPGQRTAAGGTGAAAAQRSEKLRELAEQRRRSLQELAERRKRSFPGEEDISCRRYGHRHDERPGMDTYVPQEDPEDGFIILNGVKMRLQDADQYENRI